jgi:hypothetical protein
MNIDELRQIKQGHYVFLDEKVHEVGYNLIKDIENCIYKNIDAEELLSRLEFIELTDQWLDDFGLYVTRGEYTDFNWGNSTQDRITKNNGGIILNFHNTNEYKQIIFVHQLQDLYRARTYSILRLQTPRNVDNEFKVGNIVFVEIKPNVIVKCEILKVGDDTISGTTLGDDYDIEIFDLEKKYFSPILIDEHRIESIGFIRNDYTEIEILNRSGNILFEKDNYIISFNRVSSFAIYMIEYNKTTELRYNSDRMVYLHEIQNHFNSVKEFEKNKNKV